jgi:rod shape-determining protein MreB
MDLGTANTLIYEKGRGIILNEPSVVALDSETRRVLAVGREAKSYLGRTPIGIEVIRPLKSGVIHDFAVTQQMIRSFLEMAGARRRLFRPRIVIGVPVGSTQVEKRAIIEAAEQAGGRSIHLVDEPLAAAIGLGLPVAEPVSRLVLDVGGGTSEGVLISLGAISASESRRVAGDEATEAIARFLRRKHRLAVGENMAENIKMTIGSAMPLEEIFTFNCRGKELDRGIPKMVELNSDEVREALAEINDEFVSMVKRLVTQAPPEQSADLVRHGLYITGGGSLLKGLAARLELETGLKVNTPENPLVSLALGLGAVMENMNYYKNVFAN